MPGWPPQSDQIELKRIRVGTWLAPLLVPIWRLIVDWSMGWSMPVFGSYRWRFVPYAVMPFWLANLLVPIWYSNELKRHKRCSILAEIQTYTIHNCIKSWNYFWTQINANLLTCSPITLRPSLSFSGAKRRCCFSEYFTPTSCFVWTPLDFAFVKGPSEDMRNKERFKR